MCLVKLTLMCVLQAPDCRIVLLVGLSLMTVPVAVMCFFNDDRSLGESSEAKRYHMRLEEPVPLCPSCHHGLHCMSALLRPECSVSLTNHCCTGTYGRQPCKYACKDDQVFSGRGVNTAITGHAYHLINQLVIVLYRRPAKRVQSEAELREARWSQQEHNGCCAASCPPTVLIPALILFSDLIGSLASGMAPLLCPLSTDFALSHRATVLDAILL